MNSSQQAAPITPSRTDNKTPMVGEIGATSLLQALTSSGNPLQSIVQFRKENGLHTLNTTVESFMPVIELNDLQGKPRRDFYREILQQYLALLLVRCPNLSAEQRQALLSESFPYIGFKELQKLPFTLLELTPQIPIAYLHQLSTKQDLYEQCPLSVQRQIWGVYPNLFLKKIQPIFDSYSRSRFLTLHSYDTFIPLRIRRERTPELKQLAELIGDSFPLYQRVIEYCFALYLRTGFYHYCTLRAELLLYFREINVLSIFIADPCSKFVITLSGCVEPNSTGTVNCQRLAELVNTIKDVRSGSSLRGEFAMILSDPNVITLFIKSIFHCVASVVEKLEDISDFRTHTEINNLTICVDLGLSAHSIVRECNFKKHSPGKDIFVTFYGQLIHRIVDDQLRERNENPPELSNEFVKYFFVHPTARQIILFYTMQRITAGDLFSAKQLLQLAAGLKERLNSEQYFLHSLVTLPVLVTNADIKKAVIDEFLFDNKNLTAVHVELLEFLTISNARLQADEFLHYLQEISTFRPVGVNEASYVLLFATKLSERISARINMTNAPFFFNYLEFLQNPRFSDDVSMGEPKPVVEPTIDSALIEATMGQVTDDESENEPMDE